jgi:hypothetical protein
VRRDTSREAASSLRPRLLVAITIASILALATACGRKAGGKCKPGEAICANKTTALSCQNGVLTEVACRGPLACSTFQEHANCDDSIASEGDTCMNASDEEYACSDDKKRALLCKNGKFESYLECRGKAGCALLGHQVSCDTSVAAKNDPCKVQGSSACAVDQKEMLICRDGKFAHYRYCRGQAGCYTKEDAPACDETVSLELDECGLPGFVVCSVDGQSELICQGGRFVKSRACKGGCTVIAGGRGGIDCK